VQPLYEQARVEEARNTPSVIVLDQAGPAERKAKPKGSIFAAVSLVASLLVGLIFIFFIELFSKLKSNDYEKYVYLTKWLSTDMKKITRKS
jgi:uncharacterized protein involved in exopolysaccharide biosynthesis